MSGKPVYLDYHATTPCDPAVVEAMLPYFSAEFGNEGSRNETGRRAARVLAAAKKDIAALIGAAPESLILTSGATEANNMALRGIAMAAGGRNEILIGALEHDSVRGTAETLSREGFKVGIIPATAAGFIEPEAVAERVSGKTLLVSVMAASHELGTIQPVADICRISHEAGALFHCDATQAAGKIPLNVAAMDIDLLSFSAHKLYGPQGIGALYARTTPPVKLTPLMCGGSQQRGLRPGTIPLAPAAGFGTACRIAADRMEADRQHLQFLSELLLKKLRAGMPGMEVNGGLTPRLPGSLNIRIPGACAEDILLDLANDLCLSTGRGLRIGPPGAFACFAGDRIER